MEVSLWTLTLAAVTPPALIDTVVPEPETKFVPANVTVTVVPLKPVAGVIDVIVGVGRPTVNLTALLVPLELVTVTSRGPAGASGATVSVIVTAPLITETSLAVTPVPVMPTVVVPLPQEPPPPITNPLPLSVT